MKLIHKTPLGKYSANATGVGERRKSTAQKRHLVNNIVSSIGKKKKKNNKTSREKQQQILFLQDTFLFCHFLRPMVKGTSEQPPICLLYFSASITVSFRHLPSLAPACAGPSLGILPLVMVQLLPWAWVSPKESLCKGTTGRFQSVMCLLLGVTNGYFSFPKLLPVSGNLDSKRFVNKTTFSLRRLGL